MDYKNSAGTYLRGNIHVILSRINFRSGSSMSKLLIQFVETNKQRLNQLTPQSKQNHEVELRIPGVVDYVADWEWERSTMNAVVAGEDEDGSNSSNCEMRELCIA
jgi:hypothetical protein